MVKPLISNKNDRFRIYSSKIGIPCHCLANTSQLIKSQKFKDYWTSTQRLSFKKYSDALRQTGRLVFKTKNLTNLFLTILQTLFKMKNFLQYTLNKVQSQNILGKGIESMQMEDPFIPEMSSPYPPPGEEEIIIKELPGKGRNKKQK